MHLVQDDKGMERLLILICTEAAALRDELMSLAGELRADERDRFERTLSDIQTRSAEMLMELPAATVN